MERVILHIDMDAFYASVEQLDNPDLRGKPVIVGGTSLRGVVSAASYEARRYGVHSAMPIFQARKKCPEGFFVPVRMERYKELSRHIMKILESFSPLIEQVSIDEAYMDLSGTGRLFGPPKDIGDKIKQRIKEETTLTGSIGIAPNKFLAKIASDMNKPDGFTIISPEEVPLFIKNLPIEKVPGVGKKTFQTLHKMGVFKLGDVKRLSDQLPLERTGKFSQRILELSMGIDESPVVPYTEAKSLSSEDTLFVDTNDIIVLKKQLLRQSEIIGRRLRAGGVKGKTITLKLKQADFKQITRSLTIDEPTHSSQSIYHYGLKLLKEIDHSMKFRLIGIGVSNFTEQDISHKQLNLFEKSECKEDSAWNGAEKAMDAIVKRFGKEVIKRGGLL
ncbi:DNA polymerase IV [Thermodesulfobacteriota bacterium]